MSGFEYYRIKRSAYLDAAISRDRLKDDYQDEETVADPKHGRKLIKKLRDECGIADRIPAATPEYEDVFAELLDDDPGGRILYEDHLDRLTEMVEIAERETAERRASRDLLMDQLFRKYYRPEVDLDERRSITGAFLEYNYSVEVRCRKLSYIRTACMYYGIWLVRAIPVDGIIAEKIEEILHVRPDCYGDRVPLRNIPGFCIPELVSRDVPAWDDIDSILNGIDDIRLYILRHPQQIDVQCLMSVVTGTEGLSDISYRAGQLDAAIDRFSVTDDGRSLDGIRWRELFNGWVMVKTFVCVTERILKFVNEYSDRLIGETEEALRSLLPYISYALVERNVRIALRHTLLEGSMYRFKLSDVQLTDAIRKAASRMECVSLAAASDGLISGTEEAISSDKRPIPAPGSIGRGEHAADMSFICLKDHKPCGLMLTSYDEGNVILELAYTSDKMALPALIASVYDVIEDRYGLGQTVFVPVISDRSAKLTEGLVSGAHRERLVKAQKK